ncbi:MAG: hypothetical protein WD069_13475 [Planctomycetales bacterium]
MTNRHRHPAPPAAPAACPPTDEALDAEALRTRLREKECLVVALTERLEQAAEQLDRVRRTGRHHDGGGGGAVPPELVEGQRGLLEELHEALDEWRELHGSTTLGQIEMQIAELRDLVAGRIVGGHEQRHERAPAAIAEEDGVAVPPEFPPAGESLEEEPVPEPGDEPPVPEPVDFEASDAEALTAAIRVRDEYIAWLIRKLRSERARRDGPIDAETLEHAPEELRERLATLAERLEENLRLAEIEFSMERARLAREERILRIREDQIRRLARQYELAGGASAPDEDAAAHPRGNRWLRLLGLAREADSTHGGDE